MRWGKRAGDRCGFCGNVQTLAHILACCTTALNQGRFTWRHDSVLTTIIVFIKRGLRAGLTLFLDLPGFQAPHGGVIPPHILVTFLKPDLFLFDEERRTIVMFELTCRSRETSIVNIRTRRKDMRPWLPIWLAPSRCFIIPWKSVLVVSYPSKTKHVLNLLRSTVARRVAPI